LLLYIDQKHGPYEKNEEKVVNAFETWCWRRMLKMKWTGRITNDVFQRAKEKNITFKNLKKNRRHSWIGHTEFVVNILEGTISGKKAVGSPRLQYLKQVADSYTAMKHSS
jgi:hypothetical protein